VRRLRSDAFCVGRHSSPVARGRDSFPRCASGSDCRRDQRAPESAPAAFDRVSKAATEARTQNRPRGRDRVVTARRSGCALRGRTAGGFLGELLYDQNQYPEARDSLRRLIDLDHTTGPGFALLGLCEFETKETPGRSITSIRHAA